MKQFLINLLLLLLRKLNPDIFKIKGNIIEDNYEVKKIQCSYFLSETELLYAVGDESFKRQRILEQMKNQIIERMVSEKILNLHEFNNYKDGGRDYILELVALRKK